MNVAYNVMSKNTVGYGTVYKSVLQHKNLSLSAKAVYSLLRTYCGNKDHCNPSLRRLQDDLNCSRTTIVKCIEELKSIGCLIIKKSNNQNNEYHLNNLEGGSKSEPLEVQNMNQGGTKSEPEVVQNLDSKNNIEEEHERIYKIEGEDVFSVQEYLEIRCNTFITGFYKNMGMSFVKKQLEEFSLRNNEHSWESSREFKQHVSNFLFKKQEIEQNKPQKSTSKKSETGSPRVDSHLNQMSYIQEKLKNLYP